MFADKGKKKGGGINHGTAFCLSNSFVGPFLLT